MILPILKHPHPTLREKAKKVKDPADPKIRELIDSMLETMQKTPNCLGLAANQIGHPVQICIIHEKENDWLVLINPQITAATKRKICFEEGCLSFPGKFIRFERPEKVKVRYLNEYGEKVKIKAAGLLSRALQHEIDHLNGILMIDYPEIKVNDQ